MTQFIYDSDHLLQSLVGPRGERSEYEYTGDRVTAVDGSYGA